MDKMMICSFANGCTNFMCKKKSKHKEDEECKRGCSWNGTWKYCIPYEPEQCPVQMPLREQTSYIHSNCHPEVPTWCSYQDGVLTIECPICGKYITSFKAELIENNNKGRDN